MKRKILITGAMGFLGRHAALKFSKLGDSVTGIGHGKWTDYRSWGITSWNEAEVDLENLRKIREIFDVIIHCAGGSTVEKSLSDPKSDYDRTVNTTKSVLDYIRFNNPSALLIYPSSASIYGSNYHRLISETDRCKPVSPYGKDKKIVEDLCQTYSEKYRIRIGIIRFFSLYGIGLRKQLLWDSCQKFSTQSIPEFFGTGEEVRDFLHISDGLELILKIIEKKINFNVFNGGNGKEIKIKSIVNIISGEFNNTNYKFDDKKRKGIPEYFCADISKSVKIGWVPKKPLNEGIKEYVQWYKGLKK